VAINKLDSESSDLKYLLNQKESTIRAMDGDLQSLRDKFEGLANKSSHGLNAPVHPKIVSNGQFSQKDLPSLTDKNGTVDEDWAAELRSSDDRCKQLKAKLDDQLELNKLTNHDMSSAKLMIETRDREITRLSMLYESNINLDKLNINYSMEKMTRQNENLQSQLDFLNTENNKLADMHKENMSMTETYRSNQGELKRLNGKLMAKEDEVARLKQAMDGKTEQVKRLTEQYNNSQKPALYGANLGDTK
jgi:chromosome segregation ATPase